jgi:hypothetical protein
MTRRLATIACHACEAPAELRETKKGRLYYCCNEADCSHQMFSRSLACDKRLAARATDWTDTTRRADLGAGPKAPPPEPRREETKPPAKPLSFWERPIL